MKEAPSSSPAAVREGGLAPSASRRVLDLPPEERPRERLARHGASALSSRELLALLVGTGSRRASALDVADGLLAGGLRGLAARSLRELEGTHGLGRAKATRVLAALDVRRRLRHEAVVSVGCLTASLVHPREVFQQAVVARAAAILIFHNHPSGDPE